MGEKDGAAGEVTKIAGEAAGSALTWDESRVGLASRVQQNNSFGGADTQAQAVTGFFYREETTMRRFALYLLLFSLIAWLASSEPSFAQEAKKEASPAFKQYLGVYTK